METKVVKNILLAIEYNRQQLEFARREKDNKKFDEVWELLVSLEATLADIMIEEYLKRGA